MNKTICLDKHEMVVDRDFVESVYEIAFGDDAINKGYGECEVLNKLRVFSNNSLKWEDQQELDQQEDPYGGMPTNDIGGR